MPLMRNYHSHLKKARIKHTGGRVQLSGCRKNDFTVASLQEQRLSSRSGGIMGDFLPSTVNCFGNRVKGKNQPTQGLTGSRANRQKFFNMDITYTFPRFARIISPNEIGIEFFQYI
jgi:hypothetical protein